MQGSDAHFQATDRLSEAEKFPLAPLRTGQKEQCQQFRCET